MKSTYARQAVATAWVLTLLAVGMIGHIASLSGWTVLIALAVVPLVVLYRFWREPAETMSESIRHARR